MGPIEIHGVRLPEIKRGDDVGRLICKNFELEDRDVVVVTSKIVSKAEGNLVSLDEIEPSKEAINISKKAKKNAKLVELILRRSRIIGILPMYELYKGGVINLESISKHPDEAEKLLENDQNLLITLVDDHICTDAGIDLSNTPEGFVSLPPENPMKSAEKIRESIKEISGKDIAEDIAVLISDTEVFLGGSIELCKGYAGICPVTRKFASLDIYGRPKWGGVEALAHEICCAASLVMGQAGEGVPVAVVRGVDYEECEFSFNASDAFEIIVKENSRFIGFRNILKVVTRLFKVV